MNSSPSLPLRRGKPNWGTGIGLGIIHLGALAAFIPALFSWSAVLLAVVMFYVTGGLGVTLGYHRLLTHRSFRMWKPLEYFTALCGTLALQGGPIWWVATHRKHHAHSDKDGDPHDISHGWWWAHMGWLYLPNKDRLEPEEVGRYTKDMVNDPVYVFLNTFEVPIQIAFGALLFALGGWSWLVWGVFVRLVMVYHVTWLVNSSAHMYGYRTHRTTDQSTNNWVVALLAFGEGWHNNHHAFPFSARHGMSRFEFDPTWLIIRGLSIARLAQSVRVPTQEMRDRLRIKPSDEVAA